MSQILNTVHRELSLRRNSLIMLCLIAMALGAVYTSIYPAIHAQARQLIHSLGNVYKYLGINKGISFNTLEAWMSTEMFAVTWPILVSILTAGQAGAAIAGEIESGSLGMLLSLPISRTRIYLSKYLSGICALLIFVLATLGSVSLLALATHISFIGAHFVVTGLLCLMFGLTIFSFGLMASASLSEKSHLYGLVGALMLIMYVLNTIANLKQSLHLLKYVSFFHYFDASSSLTAGRIATSSIAVFLGVSLVCTTIGLILFNKRDISI